MDEHRTPSPPDVREEKRSLPAALLSKDGGIMSGRFEPQRPLRWLEDKPVAVAAAMTSHIAVGARVALDA
jgi:hypothetical protein